MLIYCDIHTHPNEFLPLPVLIVLLFSVPSLICAYNVLNNLTDERT